MTKQLPTGGATLSQLIKGVLIIAMLGPQTITAYGVEHSPSETTWNASEHGIIPDGRDCTWALRNLLQNIKKGQGPKRLTFPKGQYNFHGNLAEERYLFISNNDEGLKRVIFSLAGFDDLTIDGQGSEFIFHGFVNPFLVEDSSAIRFQDFSIDFSRSFHSEGIIIESDTTGMVVEIPEAFPYEVHNGLLTFNAASQEDQTLTTVTKGSIYGSSHILEFDTKRRETAFMAKDYYFKGTISYPAQKLEGRKVRLNIPNLKGTSGNTLVFGPNHRKHPGFVLTRSQDVHFEAVTIHHAGGMGILGQLSSNISISNCKVTPSNGRMLSTTADATHFVNCTGYIKLTDNLFQNQKDDATNIHGIYAQVVEIVSGNEVVVQLKHRQQHGIEIVMPGAEVEFVTGKSLITFGTARVDKVYRLNKEFFRIIFHDNVPEQLSADDVIATVRQYPEVTISGNTIKNNRARGMLLNCRGKTVVENNFFHTPGAAILFEGDAFFWFEQGGVRDCVIRNNVFDNCLFGVWGKAIIDVKAGIHERRGESRYNRNIIIEGNTFNVFEESPLLNAYCVEGLIWRNNQVNKTNAYPSRRVKAPAFDIVHCNNVSIDNENPY